MSSGESKLWTNNFVVTSLVNFFTALCFYLLMIIISAYAIKTFNSSLGEAGFSASIFIIGGLVARLFCGKWIGLIGPKKTLYIGVILGLVMSCLYFCASNILLLLIVRLIHGAGFGITTTATATIIAFTIPKERYGEGIGYFGLSQILATAIGPFIGMFLMQHGSFNAIFIVCSFMSAACLFIMPLISLPELELNKEQTKETKRFRLDSFFEIKVIPISVVCCIVFFCYSTVISFLAVYSEKINLVNSASFFFLVYAIVILVSRPITGRLFDAKGENLIIYPAIVLFTAGIILFSQAHAGYILLLSAGLIGIGVGTIQPSTQAIAVKSVPRHRIGLANSTYFALTDIGMGMGPVLAGFLITFTGYRGMYVIVSIFGAACILLYHLFHGRNVAVYESLCLNGSTNEN